MENNMPKFGEAAYTVYFNSILVDWSGDKYPAEWKHLPPEKKAAWEEIARVVCEESHNYWRNYSK